MTSVAKVESHKAEQVSAAIIALLKPLKSLVHTITFDNGKEFAGHETIAAALEADCYFADPYSSWQRGLNENTNRLLLQHFPKGESLDAVTAENVAFAVKHLNTRPRKYLDWRTPQHVMLAAIKSQGVALRT